MSTTLKPKLAHGLFAILLAMTWTGHVSAQEGSEAVDAGTGDASGSGEGDGPSGDACVDTLTARTGDACNACAEQHCAAAGDACDGTCLELLSCVVDECGGNGADTACIVASCASCLGAATVAQEVGTCLQANCVDVCEFIDPVPAPPPAEGDACVDELEQAVGAECTACVADRCVDQSTGCDEGCRSLLSCSWYECDGTADPACLSASCGSCLGASTEAQAYVTCARTNCADVCPSEGPTQGGSEGGEGSTPDQGGAAGASGGEEGPGTQTPGDTPDDGGFGNPGPGTSDGDAGDDDVSDGDAGDGAAGAERDEPSFVDRLVSFIKELLRRIFAAFG